MNLYVGSQGFERLFTVHRKLLCTRVPYFNRMFGKTLKEASMGKATFPEDDAEAFDLLICWLYTGNIK